MDNCKVRLFLSLMMVSVLAVVLILTKSMSFLSSSCYG